MAAYIHHVQLCTRNGAKYLQKFVQNVNLRLFARRDTDTLKQWAVRSGSTVFIINQPVETTGKLENFCTLRTAADVVASSRKSDFVVSSSSHREHCKHGQKDTPSPPHQVHHHPLRSCQQIPMSCFSPLEWDRNIDTVFNVALEVCDVRRAVDRAQQNGANIMCEPTVVKDSNGEVTIAAVQSCVGNVVHTMLNTRDYHGVFLPGFRTVSSTDADEWHKNAGDDEHSSTNSLISHIDHITYVCNEGASGPILDWYEKCFGMKRFKLSR